MVECIHHITLYTVCVHMILQICFLEGTPGTSLPVDNLSPPEILYSSITHTFLQFFCPVGLRAREITYLK